MSAPRERERRRGEAHERHDEDCGERREVARKEIGVPPPEQQWEEREHGAAPGRRSDEERSILYQTASRQPHGDPDRYREPHHRGEGEENLTAIPDEREQ